MLVLVLVAAVMKQIVAIVEGVGGVCGVGHRAGAADAVRCAAAVVVVAVC